MAIGVARNERKLVAPERKTRSMAQGSVGRMTRFATKERSENVPKLKIKRGVQMRLVARLVMSMEASQGGFLPP